MQLLGKLTHLYKIDPNDSRVFDYDERAILEQCIRERAFYQPVLPSSNGEGIREEGVPAGSKRESSGKTARQ